MNVELLTKLLGKPVKGVARCEDLWPYTESYEAMHNAWDGHFRVEFVDGWIRMVSLKELLALMEANG